MSDEPARIRREDYKAPAFQVPAIDLEFIINSKDNVTVRSTMQVEAAAGNSSPLELQGKNLGARFCEG